MALTELPDADSVDAFLSLPSPVLLLIGHRPGRPVDAVLASLCALGPHGRVARTGPDGSPADERARGFLTRIPHADRACLVLLKESTVLDVLRSTDVEAHGERWAAAHFAERFLTRLVDG